MYIALIGGLFFVWVIPDILKIYAIALDIIGLITLWCVSYIDNRFWTLREKMVTFYLFGETAVYYYLNHGMEGLTEQINNDIEYDIYAHHESDGSMNLISEFNGYMDWTVLAEDEYSILLAMNIITD